MTKMYFVTGTDTEVGKTVVSCALLQAAGYQGLNTVGYKPVASGSELTADGLRNSDALLLQANSRVKLPYEAINPIVFEAPTSPHIISEKLNQPIEFSVINKGLAYLKSQADWLLVEGAGGWYTPLSVEKTYADWVIEQQLPVILVVGVKLGCINHALLTMESIEAAGLPVAGWVANEVEPAGIFQEQYLSTLNRMIKAPCLGVIPHQKTLNGKLGSYLDLSLLTI
ncbi:dethiobiotin synthase [Providencia hangzhouensis]|uniref:ATP-dependent dethiobiotin synthetase BioD n=1 Tax=Providencia rettgeri TaxID=587 RepID=A0A264VPM1_PRORE|nr:MULTISPECIES: dethiobiotin synthase [Providencia]EFE54661.1 dethiobiotin synthase [Providencia rettgeri DSM 1131]THB25482.1 ATP-dependent dethiobiotin synthetase BioD [Providencia sp. MGF014]MBJ9970280.1 ATP-dependent dethiobiotin synthetase BioD [Providencia rettgeri]MBN6364694.1 ATP-dependent dethiobiotin synthetase BioD [Providencia rettgeri]MBN7842270.1 ATP-dependent dethiobiotin synthetase BioD [Providencia rettgeri]